MYNIAVIHVEENISQWARATNCLKSIRRKRCGNKGSTVP